MPEGFCDAGIVTLYKNKGREGHSRNYRGCSLLSIAGKMSAHVVLNRLITILEQNLSESQRCFRLGRSTTDMIFAVRQVQEKYIEQQMPVCAIFIDLTKAFDTINVKGLWTVLECYGCPKKFINITWLFQHGMTGQMLNTEASVPFEINTGVKQGCVPAPVLFNLFFTCMLTHAVLDLEKGVYIHYHLNGSLFDLHRLSARTNCPEVLI